MIFSIWRYTDTLNTLLHINLRVISSTPVGWEVDGTGSGSCKMAGFDTGSDTLCDQILERQSIQEVNVFLHLD
jgi:hypothetical protein